MKAASAEVEAVITYSEDPATIIHEDSCTIRHIFNVGKIVLYSKKISCKKAFHNQR